MDKITKNTKRLPKISVVILTRNESENIIRCVTSIINQDYPREKIEILIIDNGSIDDTREKVQKIMTNLPRNTIKLITSPLNNLGQSRTLGIKSSNGEFVAFLDADAEAPSNWLSILIKGFLKYCELFPPLAGVGGANLPPNNHNHWYSALDLMAGSFLGHLNSSQAKRFLSDGPVQHLSTANVLYKKECLLQVGGFSAEFSMVCEDVALSNLLRRSGFHLVFISSSQVIHYFDYKPLDWLKRIFRFGLGQMMVIRRFPEHFSLRLLFPILFAVFFAVILFIKVYFFLAALFCYLVFISGLSCFLCLRAKKTVLVPRLILYFTMTHFAYGFGQLYGLGKSFFFGIK